MNRSELVKTLELVRPALATNNMVPIFQCFNFYEGAVSASDDVVAIVGPADCDEECGIHGNTLLGLLSNSQADEVTLTLEDTSAFLKLGKTISKLPFQPFENFIFSEPKGKWPHKMEFTQSVFDALKVCSETVSTDATQQALLGITLQGDRLYSCNGDSLTRVHLKNGIGKHRALLPDKFCTAILKIWSALEMTKGTLSLSNEWVFANFGDWRIYGRILEITDPIDFEELISRHVQKAVKTVGVPEGLSAALSRARVLSDPESQKTVISVSSGKLSLFTETHMGDVSDTVPMDKSHPKVVANVNASHLQRALQTCDQIAFLVSCTVLEKAPTVLQLVSNMS